MYRDIFSLISPGRSDQLVNAKLDVVEGGIGGICGPRTPVALESPVELGGPVTSRFTVILGGIGSPVGFGGPVEFDILDSDARF
jgi:hypothetical protein